MGKRGPWFLPVGAAAVGLAWLAGRWGVLTGAPFLKGADAYYYALQLRFLVENGVLKIPDFSPLYPLFSLTVKFGACYEQAIIIWSLIIQLIFAANLMIASRAASGRWRGAVLLAAWALASPTLAFTCLEFPKYAFALAWMPLWFVGMTQKRFLMVSLAAVTLSAVSHRAVLGLVGLAAVGMLLFSDLRRRVLHLLKNRLLLGGLAAAALAVILVGRRYFSLLDWQRFGTDGLQPALLIFLTRTEIPLCLKIESGLAFLLGLSAMWLDRSSGRKSLARCWLPFFVFLLVPMGSAEVMGTPERLALILPMAAACAAVGWNPRTGLSVSRLSRLLVPGAALALILAVTALPKAYLTLVHPDRLDPDNALYQKVTAAVAPVKPSMLIAHRGLNFYYEYRTMGEAFAYEPEPHWPKAEIWRIAYGIKPSEWASYLPAEETWGSGLLFDLPSPYSLVREDVWEEFRKGVAASEDEDLKDRVLRLWLNPFKRRPAFLYQKHRGEMDEGKFRAVDGQSGE